MARVRNSTRPMTPDRLKRESKRTFGIVVGAFICAFFINYFVVPAGFYTGGVLGLCQLIRTILVTYLGLNVGSIDLAGIIYYMVNIPLLVLAYNVVGRVYFLKTLIAITAEAVFFTIIPIPAQPLLVDDPLAACLIGGVGAGAANGFMLRMGASDGGTGLAGSLLIKKNFNTSIGMVNIALGAFIYAVMFFMFNAQVVIYSAIYSVASSFATDKLFSQSINVEVHIIVKKDTGELRDELFKKLGRGITKWKAIGAYTGNDKDMFYIIINKYELSHLTWIVRKYDKDAFIVANSGVSINGDFEKRIE